MKEYERKAYLEAINKMIEGNRKVLDILDSKKTISMDKLYRVIISNLCNLSIMTKALFEDVYTDDEPYEGNVDNNKKDSDMNLDSLKDMFGMK